MKIARWFAVILGTCVVGSLVAQPAEAPGTNLKTTAVAAFKSGLAFVVKQGNVHLDGGLGSIEPIPNATLGSLWIAPADAGATLDEVVARHNTSTVQQSLTVLADLLLANTGKVVTIVDANQKEYTGEIVGFQQNEEAQKPANSGSQVSNSSLIPLTGSLNSNALSPMPQLHVSPEFLLLKSEGKLMAFNFRNIVRVILPADSVLQRSQEEEHKTLQFRIKGVADHANLTLGYLEHGLGWTPSYLISLQDDKKAQITMQSVLVNDAEDLKDTDLFFVVGVPNFAYSNIPSPMALQQSLLEFMQAGSRRVNSELRFSNAITAQVVGGLDAFDAGSAPSFATTTEEMPGAQEEDLFLYSRKRVSLARGDRATYNVFSGTVNYDDIYEWNLEDPSRVDGFGNAQNNSNTVSDRSTGDNIWHSLRLQNTTRFPWTSAPTLVISGTKPLAQDTLPYTPRNAASSLKLTIATDIRASHIENEVARQRDLQHRPNYNFDLVTVEGTLTIKNYKSKDARLIITTRVRGNVESQSDNGTADKLAEAISVDNPLSRLKWELTLHAGEEKVIKYRYKIWLRV